MRHIATLVAVVALLGCDIDDDPLASHPIFYDVITLNTVSTDSDVVFVDLNENGQALWQEGDRVVLWDDGSILDVPVETGEFLGPSGEVLGFSSVWHGGQLTDLPGRTRGITEDGTIYLARNDTLFTWRGGALEATERPVGLVGPEGRIWQVRERWNELLGLSEFSCGFYLDGAWHGVFSAGICGIGTVEENGWATIFRAGQGLGGWYVGPHRLPWRLAHVNSEGHALSEDGHVFIPATGDTVNFRIRFGESIRTGAINDDGEILARIGNRVVLLIPG